MCGLVINGDAARPARTPRRASCTCGPSRDGDVIDVEPWRADAFPVIKDLVVDRSAFDRIIQAGGYISAPTGDGPRRARHPGAQARRRPRLRRRRPASAAAPASRPAPTARPSLFIGAKITHLGMLPQGQAERWLRVRRHGRPSTTPRASAAAPTSVSARPSARRTFRWRAISRLNRDLLGAPDPRRLPLAQGGSGQGRAGRGRTTELS